MPTRLALNSPHSWDLEDSNSKNHVFMACKLWLNTNVFSEFVSASPGSSWIIWVTLWGFQQYEKHFLYITSSICQHKKKSFASKIVIIWPLSEKNSVWRSLTYQNNREFIKRGSKTSRDFQGLIEQMFQQLIHYSHQRDIVKTRCFHTDVTVCHICTVKLQMLRLTLCKGIEVVCQYGRINNTIFFLQIKSWKNKMHCCLFVNTF